MKNFFVILFTLGVTCALLFVFRKPIDKILLPYLKVKPIKFILMKIALLTQPNFVGNVKSMCAELRPDADWLPQAMIDCFYIESSLNPSAVCKYPLDKPTRATGLIQFMPETAIDLGTTVEELVKMSASEQLVWVKKYFTTANRHVEKWNVMIDVYLSIFYPVAVGQGDDYQFNLSVSHANKGYDVNGDGVVTIGEIKQVLKKHLSYVDVSI